MVEFPQPGRSRSGVHARAVELAALMTAHCRLWLDLGSKFIRIPDIFFLWLFRTLFQPLFQPFDLAL